MGKYSFKSHSILPRPVFIKNSSVRYTVQKKKREIKKKSVIQGKITGNPLMSNTVLKYIASFPRGKTTMGGN